MEHHALKAYGLVGIQLHVLLTSALEKCKWSVSFLLENEPVLPRADLEALEKRKILYPC